MDQIITWEEEKNRTQIKVINNWESSHTIRQDLGVAGHHKMYK